MNTLARSSGSSSTYPDTTHLFPSALSVIVSTVDSVVIGGCMAYIECSAKTGDNVKDVFNLALKESMRGKWGKIVKQRRCVIT